METQPTAHKVLISVDDFLRRYGVSRTRAYHEINSGKLRARKLGRRTVIHVDDARNWADSLPSLRTLTDD